MKQVFINANFYKGLYTMIKYIKKFIHDIKIIKKYGYYNLYYKNKLINQI